jgi:SpoIIAA-like
MIYLDTPLATVWWDERDKWVVLEWRSYADGDDYRAILNKELDVLVARRAAKLLCDLRQGAPITASDQAWIDADWLPRLRRTGCLRFTALVLPRSAVAQLSLKRIVSKAGPVIQSDTQTLSFDDIEQAKAWLRSVG